MFDGAGISPQNVKAAHANLKVAAETLYPNAFRIFNLNMLKPLFPGVDLGQGYGWPFEGQTRLFHASSSRPGCPPERMWEDENPMAGWEALGCWHVTPDAKYTTLRYTTNMMYWTEYDGANHVDLSRDILDGVTTPGIYRSPESLAQQMKAMMEDESADHGYHRTYTVEFDDYRHSPHYQDHANLASYPTGKWKISVNTDTFKLTHATWTSGAWLMLGWAADTSAATYQISTYPSWCSEEYLRFELQCPRWKILTGENFFRWLILYNTNAHLTAYQQANGYQVTVKLAAPGDGNPNAVFVDESNWVTPSETFTRITPQYLAGNPGGYCDSAAWEGAFDAYNGLTTWTEEPWGDSEPAIFVPSRAIVIDLATAWYHGTSGQLDNEGWCAEDYYNSGVGPALHTYKTHIEIKFAGAPLPANRSALGPMKIGKMFLGPSFLFSNPPKLQRKSQYGVMRENSFEIPRELYSLDFGDCNLTAQDARDFLYRVLLRRRSADKFWSDGTNGAFLQNLNEASNFKNLPISDYRHFMGLSVNAIGNGAPFFVMDPQFCSHKEFAENLFTATGEGHTGRDQNYAEGLRYVKLAENVNVETRFTKNWQFPDLTFEEVT